MARQLKATIVLVHVIDSPRYSVTDSLNVIEHHRALHRIAGTLLGDAIKNLRDRHLAAKSALVSGAAYHEILKKARQEGADLIIMGTHGRTGLARLVLGSVPEKVLRLASCPVLTVPSAGSPEASRPKSQKGVTLF